MLHCIESLKGRTCQRNNRSSLHGYTWRLDFRKFNPESLKMHTISHVKFRKTHDACGTPNISDGDVRRDIERNITKANSLWNHLSTTAAPTRMQTYRRKPNTDIHTCISNGNCARECATLQSCLCLSIKTAQRIRKSAYIDKLCTMSNTSLGRWCVQSVRKFVHTLQADSKQQHEWAEEAEKHTGRVGQTVTLSASCCCSFGGQTFEYDMDLLVRIVHLLHSFAR